MGLAWPPSSWSPLATLPMAFLIAFVVGALVSLPALRIKGVYLALVTLALGVAFPKFLTWPKIQWLTGGPKGLDKAGFNFGRKNRTYSIFGWKPFGDMRANGALPFYFWIGLGIVVITYLVCRGVVKSRVGRSLIAIRDPRVAQCTHDSNRSVSLHGNSLRGERSSHGTDELGSPRFNPMAMMM